MKEMSAPKVSIVFVFIHIFFSVFQIQIQNIMAFLHLHEILFHLNFLILTGVDEKSGKNFLVCRIYCETDGCNVANLPNINQFLLVFGLGIIFLKNWISLHFTTNSIFHFDEIKSLRKKVI